MMLTDRHISDPQVAVLIDFENVGLSAIRWLFDQISDVGRIIVRRAYADWTQSGRNQRDHLLELGIEPIHLFHSTSGKNSSDIRLAIDAVELLHSSTVDTFVIVSSDSDFVPLVSRLRAAGKTVIGAGRKKTASRTLVISCDRYYYLDAGGIEPKIRPQSAETQEDSLLKRAVEAAMNEQGQVIGSKLIQTIQRLDPSFSFRGQGYSTFTKYLESASEVNVIRTRGQGDVAVELIDPDKPPTINISADSNRWGPLIDSEWSGKAPFTDHPISGTVAASIAANILGYEKLSDSPYKTLQHLLDSSDVLGSNWRRERNKIIRR
ncbi:MAG: NYN domain-containing protein [SAR202 cluster bacterium]|nr:NYN domain-containing protein [SAR202 cluster bacterium]